MPIAVRTISPEEEKEILRIEEWHFADVKAKEIEPSKLTKIISAFANADGGDFYVGIVENKKTKRHAWKGFANQEAGNAHLQTFEMLFPHGSGFEYEFLKSPVAAHKGYVLHAQVSKSHGIVKASNDEVYKRIGAQSLPIRTQEQRKRLEYEKGITSFETERVNCPVEAVTESSTIKGFLKATKKKYAAPEWLARQYMLREKRPTVAAVVLFADEPQAILPKHSGIKIARYKGTIARRADLDGDPDSIDGPADVQIKTAVATTKRLAERAKKLVAGDMESIEYPTETLQEIITNAVIHRDYSVGDDVQIRIFDNRVEVESPGRFPANVTAENCRTERFLRNGVLVRYLSMFPSKHNKDLGEGLDTAFQAMHDLGLKDPRIEQRDNSVLVIIPHERLASPEERIMEFLDDNTSITNSQARTLLNEPSEYRVRAAFQRLIKERLIEKVPGTSTKLSAYRKKKR